MTTPTIVTCAITGNITTRDNHPRLPITPSQIANSGIEAARAGASILHIHARDPKTGIGSMNLALYQEILDRIRASSVDVLINLTTGTGGRFIPSDHDPQVAGPGSNLATPERRVAHIVALRPDICSLDLNTMYSGSSVVINTPRNLTIMAEAIRKAGVMPELEVFDSGDINIAHDFIRKGVLDTPALFQIVLGVRFGFNATAETLVYAKSMLPAGSMWAAFGIGRAEFPVVAQTFFMGGHVRVGLEDNVYIEKGKLAPSNAALVKKAVRIVRDLGGTIATADEARKILGLKRRR